MEAPKSGLFATVFSALVLPILNFLDKSSQPRYQGAIHLTGLRREVEVKFDRYAVPHVRAANQEDMFFAQGYLHAQERLWQMDMSRRFLSGRMAELFGDFPLPWRELSSQFRGHKTSDLDFFIRLLGIRQSALQSMKLLSDGDLPRLNAYSQGINRYIEQCGKKLPWEFRLLRFAPEPWTAEDSLTIGKGLAFLLSTALYTRLNLIPLAAKLQHDPEKLRSLLPTYPTDAPRHQSRNSSAGRRALSLYQWNARRHRLAWRRSRKQQLGCRSGEVEIRRCHPIQRSALAHGTACDVLSHAPRGRGKKRGR